MTFRFSNTLKITAFLTLLVFSAQSLLQSAPVLEPSLKSKEAVSAPSFLKSPKSYFSIDRGQVQEQFLSQSTPFIYLVEDAHDSLDAQESIRQILKQLVEKEKVSLVCFEGGSEKLNRSFYDFTRDSSKNKKIWDELFKQGQIGGLERYALEASPKVKFSGLENKKVYFENVHSVQRIFREKEKLQGVLKQIDSVFEELSGKLVAGDAKKIRDLRKSFNDGRLNLIQYAKELIENGNQNRNIVSAQIEWPQMARLIKLQEFELKLKQQEAGIQKELAQVRKKTSSDLRFIWFPEQHEKVKGHLRWYFEKAVDQGLSFKKYPNLSNWVGFHVLQDEISAADLFEELGQLEADVLSKLEMPAETRTFLKLDHDYVRVKKLISLEVSRKEWNQLKSDNLNLKPLAKQLCSLYKATFHRKPKIKVWDALRLISLFKSAKSNYELVEMRDSILSKRIKEQVVNGSVKKAAVVTGGFHTDMIAAFLKAQQIGYAVISPVIGDVNNKLNYRALMDPKLSKTRQPEVSSFGTDAEIVPYQNNLKEKAFAIGKSLGKGVSRDFATLKAPTADPLQNRINSDFVFIESVIKKAKEVEIPENLLSELRSPKHGKIFERLIQGIRLRKSPRIRFYVADHPAAANLFGIPRYNGAILARDTIPAYSNRDNRGDLCIYVTRHFYQLMLKDYALYAFVLDHEFYEKFTVPNKSHEQAWRDRGWLDYFVDSNTKLNKYLKIFIDRMADEGDVEGLDRFKSSNTEKGRLSYEYAQMKKRDVLSRAQLFLTIKPEVDDKEVDAWRVNKAIANRGINLEIQYAKFENEERYAYVPDPEYVKGKDCTLFFNKPDSNRELIKLLFAAELLEDCGAKSITLILPANVPAWIQDSLRAFATIQLVNTKQAKNRKKHDHLPAHGDPILMDKKKIRPPSAKEFDRILIMPNADKYEWRGMHNLAYLQMNEANGRMQIPQGLKAGGHYLLIAMTDRHNEVLRLLETLSALARKGIHPVVFVPYFSYGRQHMAYPVPKHGPKAISSNSARAILKAISQFSSRVYGVNMHFTKHPGEMDVEKEFPGLGSYIQIHNVNLFPQLVLYFQKNEDLVRPLIVGADKGAHDFALEAARISGMEYGKHMDKVRDGSKPTQMQVDMKMPDTDVSGRDVILLDDIIASGTTIINAALLLKSRGAHRIFVGTVYGEFTKGIEIFGNQDVIKKQIEKLKASGQLTEAQSETLNASLSKAPLIDGLKATDIMLALNPENVVSLTSILDLNKLMMTSPASPRKSIYEGKSLGRIRAEDIVRAFGGIDGIEIKGKNEVVYRLTGIAKPDTAFVFRGPEINYFPQAGNDVFQIEVHDKTGRFLGHFFANMQFHNGVNVLNEFTSLFSPKIQGQKIAAKIFKKIGDVFPPGTIVVGKPINVQTLVELAKALPEKFRNRQVTTFLDAFYFIASRGIPEQKNTEIMSMIQVAERILAPAIIEALQSGFTFDSSVISQTMLGKLNEKAGLTSHELLVRESASLLLVSWKPGEGVEQVLAEIRAMVRTDGASLGEVSSLEEDTAKKRAEILQYEKKKPGFVKQAISELGDEEHVKNIFSQIANQIIAGKSLNESSFISQIRMVPDQITSFEQQFVSLIWKSMRFEKVKDLRKRGRKKEVLASSYIDLNLKGSQPWPFISLGNKERLTVGGLRDRLIQRSRYVGDNHPEFVMLVQARLQELGLAMQFLDPDKDIQKKLSQPMSSLKIKASVSKKLTEIIKRLLKTDQEISVRQFLEIGRNEFVRQGLLSLTPVELDYLEKRLEAFNLELGILFEDRWEREHKATAKQQEEQKPAVQQFLRIMQEGMAKDREVMSREQFLALAKEKNGQLVRIKSVEALGFPNLTLVVLRALMQGKDIYILEHLFSLTLEEMKLVDEQLKRFLSDSDYQKTKQIFELVAELKSVAGKSLGGSEKIELRQYFEGLEKDKREDLLRNFIASDPAIRANSERALAIIESRILSEQETLQQISDRFHVTRTRVGQIEARLTQKLWRYLRMGNSPDYDKKNETLTRLFAEGRKSEMLERSISELGLTPRVESALFRIAEERFGSRIMTIGQLIEYTAEGLLLKKNIGYESLQDVENRLEKFGLTFSDGRDLDEKRRFEELERSMIEKRREAVSASSIRVLGLNTRSLNVLTRVAQIEFGQDDMTIGQLTEFTEGKLLSERGMGGGSLQDIKSRLAERGLKLSEGKSLGQSGTVSLNAVMIIRDVCGGIIGVYLKDVAPEIYQSLIPRFASDKPAGKSLVITGPVSPIALIDQIKGHKTVIVYYEDEAYKEEFEQIAEKMKEKGEVLQEELDRYGYFAYLPKLHLTRAEFVRQVLKNVKVDYDGVGPRSIGRIASQSGIRNYVNRLVWQGDEALIHQVIEKMPVVLGRPLRVTKSGNDDTDLIVLKLASLLSENPEALEKKGLLVLENGIYVPTDLFYSFLDKALAEHNFEKLTATMA